MTVYAIGDIHGQLALLTEALERIEQDGVADAQVVFLGDYVDRGPDSSGVLEFLASANNPNWVFLKGNHDRLMEWFMQDPPRHDPHLLIGYHWLHDRLGGQETLASYGITEIDRRRMFDVAADARAAVPEHHQTFIRDLPLKHHVGDVFFTHAGVRPGVALDQQDEQDLLWIRQEFHESPADHGALIVHGHTPVELATHYGNRVNLDSGAAYGGPLSAAVFEGSEVFLLTENGRKPLKPE